MEFGRLLIVNIARAKQTAQQEKGLHGHRQGRDPEWEN